MSKFNIRKTELPAWRHFGRGVCDEAGIDPDEMRTECYCKAWMFGEWRFLRVIYKKEVDDIDGHFLNMCEQAYEKTRKALNETGIY